MKLLAIFSSFVLFAACLLRSPPADKKFIAWEHQWNGRQPHSLIDIVHKLHWNISYSYGADCAAEQRNNDDALTAEITAVLQMWLQPLREYGKKKGKIVADFRYLLGAAGDNSDLHVVFYCDLENSTARPGKPPLINMRHGTNVDRRGFVPVLVHEMGHAFGLADTYLFFEEWGDPQLDKGGKNSTKGTQPTSIMSGVSIGHKGGTMIGRDDKNGVIWLYKRKYEGLPSDDCFFDDYELEHVPLGCRPKHPLIFGLKHSSEIDAIFIIEDDEHLDVNARDAKGMTALHYAVSYNYRRVVQLLLRHKDIKPFLTDGEGKTPVQLAKELGHDELAQLIAAHPKAMPVAAKGKQTTTWGELKKEE